MNQKREQDEHLERLWHMREDGTDSFDALKSAMRESFSTDIIDGLSSDNLVEVFESEERLTLTASGERQASRLIRAHRLAERLLYDVLGGDFEEGACEFEHIIAPEVVDGICTLLGHPRECPHGMSIPNGDCCKRSMSTAQSSVVPLTELDVGQHARVAYVNCSNDQQLHRIDGLHIRPGAIVNLHQKYPSYVIECEDTHVALDTHIAANICVWKSPEHKKRPT